MTKPGLHLGGVIFAICLAIMACRSTTPTGQPEQASELLETMQAMTTPIQSVVMPTEAATQALSSIPVLQNPEAALSTTPALQVTPAPQIKAASPTPFPTAPAITLVPPAGFVVYVTRPGETLQRLADRF